MRKLIFIALLAIGMIAQAQVDVITLDKVGADSLKGRYGRWSALDPVKLPDGSFMLPTRCITDPKLTLDSIAIVGEDTTTVVYQIGDILTDLNQGSTAVEELPDVGQTVTIGHLYKWDDPNSSPDLDQASPLVMCRQTHIRTADDPNTVPALFSFFRLNRTDTLSWIEGEWVEVGYIRNYNDVMYRVIQAHQTLSTWTPDVVPALFSVVTTGCGDWSQPIGASDAYMRDACVTYNSIEWFSTVDFNVWQPGVYGWVEK